MIAVWIILGCLIYIFPGMLAFRYRQPGAFLFFILNVLIGWTIVGWLVCLIIVVARGDRRKRQRDMLAVVQAPQVIVNNIYHGREA